MPHYEKFETFLKDKYKESKRLKLLSAACSTGEEVYSFAMVLEAYKKLNLKFDYEISAFDIDPVSVEIAKKASYELKESKKIPDKHQKCLTKMVKEDMFTFESTMKMRSRFYTDNLIKLQNTGSQFDAVVCRNVLIYFTPDKVKAILQNLVGKLVVGGILIIGHSDSLNAKDFNLKSLGSSMYEKL
jgi:chemotaxis protein methyltransferase CheR